LIFDNQAGYSASACPLSLNDGGAEYTAVEKSNASKKSKKLNKNLIVHTM
jgi:hypothetical protein